ncbi:MAG: diguanylate cyclase [Sulfurimonas sp.]|nr:diguanylate cyclase [Sulfurimonas sp.]
MNTSLKYIIFYIVFAITAFALYYPIDIFTKNSIDLQKNILIKQAQTHFNDQINTREWNAQYGGVYVKPKKGQKPNPYLKNNILKVDDNLTLIKINPAWMTRQLSELAKQSDIKDFHFKITSLTPINPNNIATPFEKKALKYFAKSKKKEYYEFNRDNKFNYMGALVTTKSCLPCHEHQGYKIDDIRGGISINLNSSEYESIKLSLEEKSLLVKIFLFIFLFSIAILIHKQLKHTLELEKEIKKRTKEINSTKILLQNILDNDKSFLLVSNGTEVIFANQTFLDFADFSSLSDFKSEGNHISDRFEKVDDPDFLHQLNNGVHWIEYMQKEQQNKNLKVLIKKNSNEYYFKLHSKEINIDNKLLYLITFDDITDDYIKIKDLTTEASTDPLTGLFNRRKLNGVLSKEIDISSVTKSPLSIIFLDIDHFKNVNDTFGHDVGDEVLTDLSKIITSATRQGDFIARWGGEEFMIALQATDNSAASHLAEKIRVAVEAYSFNVVGNITISLGVTEYQQDESKNNFTKRVDKALYEAKESGRNKVVVK